jgi:hypothetical protein
LNFPNKSVVCDKQVIQLTLKSDDKLEKVQLQIFSLFSFNQKQKNQKLTTKLPKPTMSINMNKKDSVETGHSNIINSVNNPESASQAILLLKNRLSAQNQNLLNKNQNKNKNSCSVCNDDFELLLKKCDRCLKIFCWKHLDRVIDIYPIQDLCCDCQKNSHLPSPQIKIVQNGCCVCKRTYGENEQCSNCQKWVCWRHNQKFRLSSPTPSHGCPLCFPDPNLDKSKSSPPKRQRTETQPETPKKWKLKCNHCKTKINLLENQTTCPICKTPFITSAQDPRIKIAHTDIKPGISTQENKITNSVTISDSAQFFKDLPSAPLPPPVLHPSLRIDPNTKQQQIVWTPQQVQKTTTTFEGPVSFENF